MKPILLIFSNTKAVILPAALLAAGMLSSCVHEWPETKGNQREVRIDVSHTLHWDQFDITVSRTPMPETSVARYHFKIYESDHTDIPVSDIELTRNDLTRNDFTTSVYLPEGDYTLYAWSDIADATTSKSHFFDSSDFSAITYSEPYNGNNDLRDAFRGVTSFHVGETIDDSYTVSADLPMERPLSRYEFISTDLVEFLEGEASRGMFAFSRGDSPLDIPSRVPEFNRYRVRMIYSGYMPSTFNNLTNKPVDSSTGVNYDAQITVLNESEARLGFDHVMVNGAESSVAVALEIYDPDNELIGRVNTINVPTKRGSNTTVRGRFLTSKATGGVGIDPDFDGDYNIEIK